MGYIVRVDSISVKLGKSMILKEVSLELSKGEILAVLGPNGAGKTTLLRTILGIVKPCKGQVVINGKNVELYSPHDLARIVAYVPQETIIPFPYLALDIVLMGKAPYLGLLGAPGKEDYIEALNIMNTLGIQHLAYRSFNTLSGGEKRLVLIARALMQKPQVLLLDEPTSGLDLRNKLKILSIMRKLSEDSVAVMFTTHDPNEAIAIADKVVVLNNGSIVFSGSPRELTTEILEKVYNAPVKKVSVAGKEWILTVI